LFVYLFVGVAVIVVGVGVVLEVSLLCGTGDGSTSVTVTSSQTWAIVVMKYTITIAPGTSYMLKHLIGKDSPSHASPLQQQCINLTGILRRQYLRH
jgi:hypothetical protein